jgi:hypothetical protein
MKTEKLRQQWVTQKTMYTKREIRAELRRQLKQYEAFVGYLAPDERKALHEWVADGNSVYDNPGLIAVEDGNPLCYIEAIRLIADMWSNPENYNY